MATPPWREKDSSVLLDWLCDLKKEPPTMDEIIEELALRPESEVIPLVKDRIRTAPPPARHSAGDWPGAWRVAALLKKIGSPRAVAILLSQVLYGGPISPYAEEPLYEIRDPQIAPAIKKMITVSNEVQELPPGHSGKGVYKRRLLITPSHLPRLLAYQGDRLGLEYLMGRLDDPSTAFQAVSDIHKLLEKEPDCFPEEILEDLTDLPTLKADRFLNPYRSHHEDLNLMLAEVSKTNCEAIKTNFIRRLALNILIERK